jgi:transposase
VVNGALERLSPRFERICAQVGRPSIAPERLLRALLLQALFTIRSERQLMQQISYNMLLRWFVGLAMDVPVWDVTVFTKNRDRLLRGDIARGFLAAILVDPRVKPLLSSEHFSVDGTLIEAGASMKSFRPKDGRGEPPAPGRNGERDFHGETRSSQTHASSTDPDAKLYKKSPGSAAVAAEMTPATGTAKREAAVAMVEALAAGQHMTMGADKAYDTGDFVAEMRRLGSRRTCRSTPTTGGLRSMAAPRVIPVMRSACGCASASRKCSAGSSR